MSEIPKHCHEQTMQCAEQWGEFGRRMDGLDERFRSHEVALTETARVLRSLERCQDRISVSLPRLTEAAIESNRRVADLEASVNQIIGESRWHSKIMWWIVTAGASAIVGVATWFATGR